MEENSGMRLRLAGRVYREDISIFMKRLSGLVQYGLIRGLYLRCDAVYARNQILLDVMEWMNMKHLTGSGGERDLRPF